MNIYIIYMFTFLILKKKWSLIKFEGSKNSIPFIQNVINQDKQFVNLYGWFSTTLRLRQDPLYTHQQFIQIRGKLCEYSSDFNFRDSENTIGMSYIKLVK